MDVGVRAGGLLIRLRLNGLNSLIAELQGDGPAEVGHDGQTVDVRVPVQFKVRGGRKEIILPADTEADVGPRSPLVLALARAYRWQGEIDSGEVPGAEAIAARHGVNRAYVSRILGLAMLAPDLTQAALNGDEPGGLSLRRLAKRLPSGWDEQRTVLHG